MSTAMKLRLHHVAGMCLQGAASSMAEQTIVAIAFVIDRGKLNLLVSVRLMRQTHPASVVKLPVR